MTAPSPVIKQTAKTALKPRLLPSVIVCCVLLFSHFIVDRINQLVLIFAGIEGYFISSIVLGFFVISPLFLGVLNFFNRVVWGMDDSVIIVFKYFSSFKAYVRALKFILRIDIKLLFIGTLLFFPCIIISIFSTASTYAALNIPYPVWASVLNEVNKLMFILSFFVLMFIMLKYYLSGFVFVSNDDIEPDEATNMSTIISKRTGGDFFGLVLSFGPWILLSLLIVPLVITLPYFLTCYCVHSHHAIQDYNHDVERFGTESVPTFSPDEL